MGFVALPMDEMLRVARPLMVGLLSKMSTIALSDNFIAMVHCLQDC